MNSRYLVAAGAIIVLLVIIFVGNRDGPPVGMSYDANDIMREDLRDAGIDMSSIITMIGRTAADNCRFVSGTAGSSHCTSTELEYNGEFLGNIHMVGTSERPDLVLGVVQSDSAVSEYPQIVAITDIMVRNLICDCWIEDMSIAEWIRDTASRSGPSQNTISHVDGLPQPILLEVTGNDDGLLWKILIGKAP